MYVNSCFYDKKKYDTPNLPFEQENESFSTKNKEYECL